MTKKLISHFQKAFLYIIYIFQLIFRVLLNCFQVSYQSRI